MWGLSMSKHKFKVGQTVDYTPAQRGLAPSARGYKILQLMPKEGAERLYRIKAFSEVHERVARESELSYVTMP
jgi:hypothetical protein